MMRRNVDPALCELLATLGRLAQDPDQQLEYLEELGDRECIDELALEFDDAVRPVLSGKLDALSTRALHLLNRVASLLASMSGEAHGELWTSTALAVAQEWAEVRQLAKAALEALSECDGAERG